MVRLTLSADRHVAHVAARLCAANEKGESWLVTYVLRNLTHRDSHSDPCLLTPGESFDVTLPMSFIAHRFAKGERIRLAISPGLWPLVWPAPEPVQLNVRLGCSSLTLPVRPEKAAPQGMPIPLKTRAPGAERPSPVTARDSGCRMEPGRPSTCHWTQTEEGRWTCGDSDCVVEASYDLTATLSHFHLAESLTARRGGSLVFERRAASKVPRKCL